VLPVHEIFKRPSYQSDFIISCVNCLLAISFLHILPWCNEDIINLVNLRNKSLLSGDLKAKIPAWISHTSKPSGKKFLTLLITNDFQISAPQSPTLYTPRGNGDAPEPSKCTSFRCHCLRRSLDSDQLPIFFDILGHVSARDSSPRVETHTDWDLFPSPASDSVQPRLQINTVEEAERAAGAFAASVVSAYIGYQHTNSHFRT